MTTPAAQGFFMPAEWQRHKTTWIAWPHARADWPGKFAPIPWVYSEIVRTITRGERARILVRNAREEDAAREILSRAAVAMTNVDFHIVATNRAWLRDSGPTFLRNKRGQRMVLDWRFTGWAKYPNCRLDDRVPAHVAELTGLPIVQPMHKGRRVVLEGGAIDVDGNGTLMTTEECLLSRVQCRNVGFARADYEKVFADWLGIRKVIWLERGIAGDDTHGHVDDLARFVAPHTVVTVVETAKSDANYAPLKDNLTRLKAARDATGKRLTVVELPMPKPIAFDGVRLPASYANFLITNAAVIVPTFNDRNDRIALDILAELFPKRDVIGIHAADLVLGLGTIHCLSQQETA